MRVASENPLLLTQVIVNPLVVLVDVATYAIGFYKVTGGVVRLIGHREVGQKRDGSGIEPGGINDVRLPAERELRSASWVGCRAV